MIDFISFVGYTTVILIALMFIIAAMGEIIVEVVKASKGRVD